MADNAQNIPPQDIQQPEQLVEKPVREFIQVDTSTNAYMGKGKRVGLESTPKCDLEI